MKHFFYLFVALLFITSCSNDEKVTFSCSIDQNYGWVQGYNSIYNGDGHSGNMCSKIDSINPFSFGFTYLIKNINKKSFTKATFSAWVKVENIQNGINLVVAITSDNGKKQLQWVGYRIAEFVKTPNQWTIVNGEIQIPENLPDDAQISFYAWSPKGESGFIDDFEIIF